MRVRMGGLAPIVRCVLIIGVVCNVKSVRTAGPVLHVACAPTTGKETIAIRAAAVGLVSCAQSAPQTGPAIIARFARPAGLERNAMRAAAAGVAKRATCA